MTRIHFTTIEKSALPKPTSQPWVEAGQHCSGVAEQTSIHPQFNSQQVLLHEVSKGDGLEVLRVKPMGPIDYHVRLTESKDRQHTIFSA